MVLVSMTTKLLFSPSPAGSYRHSVTKFLTATDGADAVAMYAQHRDEIAVVLNDMVMTVMDGAATIHALTRINPKIKIIAASGLNVNGGRDESIRSRH
jgi:CheY-like chemotaxis protein